MIQVNHDYAKDTTGKAWFIRLRKAFHESLRRSLASEQKRPWELLPTELLKVRTKRRRGPRYGKGLTMSLILPTQNYRSPAPSRPPPSRT